MWRKHHDCQGGGASWTSKALGHALDLGWKVVLGLKMFGKAMSHHAWKREIKCPCHMCNMTILKEDVHCSVLVPKKVMFGIYQYSYLLL